MRQISCFFSRIAVLLVVGLVLAGCSVSSSMLGDNLSGIGSMGSSAEKAPPVLASNMEPGITGSVVPVEREGDVVDLPYAQGRSANSSYPGGQRPAPDAEFSQDEEDLSAAERHRRELVNRGDLQEGEPLPSE